MKFWRRTGLFLCQLGLVACSLLPSNRVEVFKGANIEREAGALGEIQQQLLDQLKAWQGTPYRLGGSTRNGIDCSAFVQNTFQERFQVSVPRNTEQQVQTGFDVGQKQLVPGDLVFFKTGRLGNHVGMYLGTRWFLHASTSAGVTLNSLDDPYWRGRYWTARRVLF